MNGRRLPDGETPRRPGEYAWMPYAARQTHHPDEVGDGEWWVCDPRGAFYRLVASVHSWTVHDDGTASFSPSIVAPSGGYHGFLRAGVWT